MTNKINKEQEKELCKQYQNNSKTIKELSIQYKLTTNSICNYLKRNNIKIKIGKNLYEQKEKIFNLYLKKDLDIVSISKIYNVSPSSIHRLLKKNNIIIKDKSKVRQKFKIDENYFKKINSEQKAYFLGLIYADGCLSKSRYQFYISLQEKDKKIIQILKKELKYNGKLKKIDRYNKINPKNQVQYMLRISNKTFYNDLLNLGVTPNKSLVLTFPTNETVPEKFIKNFILGYFDGDGCITKTPSNQKYISFLGTFEFLSKIKEYFTKNNLILDKSCVKKFKESKIYIFRVGGNKQINNIYKYLYDSSTIFFKRKKQKFES